MNEQLRAYAENTFKPRTALYKALLKAQPKIVSALKDSNNPHFRSTYASLSSVIEACKEQLNNEGIIILQPAGADPDGKTWVKTVLIHAESGESIESKVILPPVADIQKLGSSMTYARRYSLQSLILLPSEDDDGNAASNQAQSTGNNASYNQAPKAPVKGGLR